MSKVFTGVQKDVLDSQAKNLLVSAGAGSGKTTIMIQKITPRFTIIYVTEQLYSQMEETVSKYTDSKLPAIIPIPNKDGSLGIGMASVKKSVERAVGADILFGGE